MRNEDLSGIAGELNQVPAAAERTARLAPLVVETNTLVRTAADELVTLDATALSFQALKASFEPSA
jgi:hypothetical protein